MFKQRTLRQSVETVGIGLHSGRKVHLVLRPAEPDTGILYRRVDIRPAVEIPAHPLNVNDTRMATTVNVGKAGGELRLPASPGGHRRAGRAQALRAGAQARRGSRGRQARKA